MPLTPHDTATLARLLDAMEELGHREDIALAHGDAHALLDLEQRCEPVARRLAELASSGAPLPHPLAQRGQALLAARAKRHTGLEELRRAIRDELDLLDAARARARSLRSRPAVVDAPAFSASG